MMETLNAPLPPAASAAPLTRTALRASERQTTLLIVWLFTAVVVVPNGVLLLPVPAVVKVLLAATLAFAGILLLFRIPGLLEHRDEARARRWLGTMPWRFDGEGYLRLLGRDDRRTRGFDLELTFTAPLPAEEQQRLARTFGRGALRWLSPERASLRSPALPTWFRGGDDGYYCNQRVHRWFRGAVDSVAAPLHGQHPLATLALQERNEPLKSPE